MPGELEYSEHSHESDHSEDGQRHGLVRPSLCACHSRLGRGRHCLVLGHHCGQCQKVRNDRHHVNDVHHVTTEADLVRTGGETHHQLEREPDDADCLDEEERVGDGRHLVLLHDGEVVAAAVHSVVFELGQRLQTEDDDGEQDDRHGDDGHDARVLRALRVLE